MTSLKCSIGMAKALISRQCLNGFSFVPTMFTEIFILHTSFVENVKTGKSSFGVSKTFVGGESPN